MVSSFLSEASIQGNMYGMNMYNFECNLLLLSDALNINAISFLHNFFFITSPFKFRHKKLTIPLKWKAKKLL